MDQDTTYNRVAESYFQALLRSGHDPKEAARELENAAAFLTTEGQLEVAQALREISRKYRIHDDKNAKAQRLTHSSQQAGTRAASSR